MNVYDYIDYRHFIRDKFEYLKNEKPQFSYRFFNRKAGIKSSGFLKLIIDGKRNLGSDGIHKISKGFDLNDKERKFFEVLVKFNQSKTHDEKDHFFKELSKFTQFQTAKPIANVQYNLFTHWYYVAILELVRLNSNEIKDANFLAEHIKPSVSLWDIKKAIKDLKTLELLVEDKKGNLIRKDAMLTTDDEVQSVAVANFHIKMSELAALSIKDDPSGEREFSAITSAMSYPTYNKVKKEIQEFRRKIHSLIEQEESGERKIVGQMNFQLFQLTKIKE